MTVFIAMLLDAYRELNSKKLFWIILGLSGLIVLFFGSIGFNDSGMSMFYGLKNIESEYLTEGSLLAQVLYRSIFTWFMVGLWLAWVATILALVSTAAIFPDFVAGGAIDMVLSKPISRVALFAIKYAVSLLFVVLQVTVFSAGVFLCLGIRLDDWDWRIFAAIPIVTLFYSFLFCVTVLVGVWTRSALTALLVTFVFWSSQFGINLSEELVNRQLIGLRMHLEDMDETAQRLQPDRAGFERPVGQEYGDLQDAIDDLEQWVRRVRAMHAFFPKTNQTIDLLDRLLKRDSDVNLLDIFSGNVIQDESGAFVARTQRRDREALRRMEAEYQSTSVGYILGTSLLFEAVVLTIACVIFVRRDY